MSSRSHKGHITQRLARALRYTRTVSHLRHYRGYGVHSPFAYSLVRNVFMKHEVMGADHAIFDSLTALGVGNRRSIQIQNIYTYCKYRSFNIDSLSTVKPSEYSLTIATQRSTVEEISLYAASVENAVDHHIFCIVYPRNNSRLSHCCRQLVKRHDGMSVDNIGFMLLVYNPLKAKQHLKL